LPIGYVLDMTDLAFGGPAEIKNDEEPPEFTFNIEAKIVK